MNEFRHSGSDARRSTVRQLAAASPKWHRRGGVGHETPKIHISISHDNKLSNNHKKELNYTFKNVYYWSRHNKTLTCKRLSHMK